MTLIWTNIQNNIQYEQNLEMWMRLKLVTNLIALLRKMDFVIQQKNFTVSLTNNIWKILLILNIIE